MSFNDFMKFGYKDMPESVVLRKVTAKNPDPSRNDALKFEVGRLASAHTPELGEISAIVFERQKSLDFGDCIHSVYIRKPNGEEYVWKQLWRDRVVEFDIDF